jgi:SAM-dependent methyltransferase
MRPALPVDVQVKEIYDQAARAGASSLCCAPRDTYAEADLAGIPGWVLELSSGCGSPLGSVDLRPSQAVADFGCGAGLDLIIAARRVGPAGKVIGVDASAAMVRTARRAVREAGLGNVDVRVGDLRRPPLRDASVDVLLCNCVLSMFPDKGAVLGEMARVLAPGGYAVISDAILAGDEPAAEPGEEDWGACVVGLTEREYRDVIAGAGFAGVRLQSRSPVQYRDGAQVVSATLIAYRGDAPPGSCC